MLTSDGTYQITAPWETGLSNGAVVGEILGLMITGIIAERWGYRFTIGLALCLVVCWTFVSRISPLMLIDLLHLHHLLRRQHSDVASRGDIVWYSLGMLPDHHHRLCC